MSVTPRIQLPTHRVAIPELYIFRMNLPGDFSIGGKESTAYGSAAPKRGIAKSQTIKGEKTPWLKCSYTVLKIPQKAVIPIQTTVFFLKDLLLSVTDADNVAHRPFLNAVAVCCRIIYYVSVKIHCGGASPIKIVSGCYAKTLHKFGKLIK